MTKLSSSPWHGITVTHRIWKSTEQEELLDEISELMKVTDDAIEDAWISLGLKRELGSNKQLQRRSVDLVESKALWGHHK